MNQVGDIVIFTAPGTLPGSATPFYVWKFWDGETLISAESGGTVAKYMNYGGNPAETLGTAPFALPYRVEICNDQGTVLRTLLRKVSINNPPTLYRPSIVSPNDIGFPFQTQIAVQAYDLENNGVNFYWYFGTTAIGGHDVKTGPVSVPGTYYGTLTGFNCNAYTDVLTATVNGAGTVYTCKMVDGDGGTNMIHVPVGGFDPAAPQFSVATLPDGLTVDASTLPDAVIAPGQQVNFSAYAYDPTAGLLVFTWYLYGTNGWTQPGIPIINHGVTTVLPQGYRNDFTVGIANETGGGIRTAVVAVTNQSTGLTATTDLAVTMTVNVAPVVSSVGAYTPDGAQALSTVSKALHTVVRFTGTGSDANDDVIWYKWDVFQPSPVLPSSMLLYGRDCFVDIGEWPIGGIGSAVVTPYDKYGIAGSPISGPQLTITA